KTRLEGQLPSVEGLMTFLVDPIRNFDGPACVRPFPFFWASSKRFTAKESGQSQRKCSCRRSIHVRNGTPYESRLSEWPGCRLLECLRRRRFGSPSTVRQCSGIQIQSRPFHMG